MQGEGKKKKKKKKRGKERGWGREWGRGGRCGWGSGRCREKRGRELGGFGGWERRGWGGGVEGVIWKEVTPEKASLLLSLINFSCRLILLGGMGIEEGGEKEKGWGGRR